MKLEQFQLEVGYGTPVLLLNFEMHGCITTKGWIKCLWKEICREDIGFRCNRIQKNVTERDR